MPDVPARGAGGSESLRVWHHDGGVVRVRRHLHGGRRAGRDAPPRPRPGGPASSPKVVEPPPAAPVAKKVTPGAQPQPPPQAARRPLRPGARIEPRKIAPQAHPPVAPAARPAPAKAPPRVSAQPAAPRPARARPPAVAKSGPAKVVPTPRPQPPASSVPPRRADPFGVRWSGAGERLADPCRCSRRSGGTSGRSPSASLSPVAGERGGWFFLPSRYGCRPFSACSIRRGRQGRRRRPRLPRRLRLRRPESGDRDMSRSHEARNLPTIGITSNRSPPSLRGFFTLSESSRGDGSARASEVNGGTEDARGHFILSD